MSWFSRAEPGYRESAKPEADPEGEARELRGRVAELAGALESTRQEAKELRGALAAVEREAKAANHRAEVAEDMAARAMSARYDAAVAEFGRMAPSLAFRLAADIVLTELAAHAGGDDRKRAQRVAGLLRRGATPTGARTLLERYR